MNEILIYGSIGESFWDPENSITAKSVMNQLAEIDGDVTVHISSGGGDVYAGIDIMNALKNHEGEVTVIVESLAASAASFIAVGGADKVLMRESSELMIHKAWTWAEGNADEVRRTLDDLDRQDLKLAKIYMEKAGGVVDEWLDRMSAETWYTADEAVAAGLADGLVGEPAVVSARKIPSFQASRKRYKYDSRAAAPPPPLASRSVSAAKHKKKGDTVSILNQLADEIGKSPEDVAKALTGFFNEAVQISGEVEVTYPNDVKIIPTEKIKVEPVIGDKPAESGESDGGEASPVVEPVNAEEPAGDSAAVQLAKQAGLTFAMGDVAEGFTAEVDEGGVVTITAPSGAEVGSTADFTVLVNETAVALSVTVRSLSEESTEETSGGDEQLNPAPNETVTLDMETFNEMKAAARLGWEAKNAADKKAREDEVDTWIREGRINPVRRAKVINEMHRDPDAARALFGAIPKNTIPMAELGYSKSDDVVRETTDKNFDARAVAASRRKEGKNV